MYDALPSLNRRARRLSSLALMGVALVAACDTDETVAPKPAALAAIPAAAQPQLGPGKTGSIRCRKSVACCSTLPRRKLAPTFPPVKFTRIPAAAGSARVASQVH